MTLVIVLVTVAVSIACFSNEGLFYRLACVPYRVAHGREWWRLVTHGFVHADWVHLFVNMFTFYSFGMYVEGVFGMLGWGRWAFAVLYFGGMVVASAGDLLKRRGDPGYVSVGASGAVSAVLFTAIFFDPWNRIYLFAAVPVPGILFGVFYLLYCQYMGRRGGDGVNHDAHFYGAMFGLVLPVLLDRRLLGHFVERLLGGTNGLF